MYPTSAIVIGRLSVGEADRILTLITPQYGKLRVSAKGVRKIKSRLAGHLELFSKVNLTLAKGRNIDVITSAQSVGGFEGIATDYNRLDLAYLMAMMIDKLSLEGEQQKDLYELAEEYLDFLGNCRFLELIELGFKLRLLNILGYLPVLSACVVCGYDKEDGNYYLNTELGGIVDDKCRGTLDFEMNNSAIKLWRLALMLPLSKLEDIVGAENIALTTLDYCDSFYEYQFGKRYSRGLLGV
jgi:DNA repair protein RecO (recombination protein O)